MKAPIPPQQAIAFRSEEALQFFRKEWKRRNGGTFKPVRRGGENHGFFLTGPFELLVGMEIETLKGEALTWPSLAGLEVGDWM